uniref:5-methyltetrahydropteroyltriglutamate-- homocysteine methyltransferase-like n=1 Tax=Saccoglossus kowalevskii TaxID=10224 RepID=A0ABM0MDR4_SACKO|nr:PREDICTED: 5-methyltetrahydropteroyltriglutamate--homocysteine methyltransferase-like [Saccoglossus kowalevskii]
MPLTTTVIGSYPKPDYLGIPDWFDGLTSTERYSAIWNRRPHDRRIKGFNFNMLTETSTRNGAWTAKLPTITGKIELMDGNTWAAEEWRGAQNLTDTPVKFTIPGPATLIGSTHNAFYDDKRTLSEDLVKVINYQIRALAKAGCRHIQLDEPVFARFPDTALNYGIEHAERCFDGIGLEVEKTVHICCGYPCYLDQQDYQKADQEAYFKIIDKLDSAGFDAISLEDAHRYNDLRLLDRIKKSKVVLGAVTIANSRVETVEEIRNRLEEVLRHIPASRLMVSPDCGLGFLPPPILKEKLANMVAAAKSIQCDPEVIC